MWFVAVVEQGRRILFFFVFLFHPFRVIIVGEIALSRGCAIAPPRAVIFSPFQGSNQAIIKLLAMSQMSIYFRMRRPCGSGEVVGIKGEV